MTQKENNEKRKMKEAIKDTTKQYEFDGILPAHVRYDANLSPAAKLLYGDINAIIDLLGFYKKDVGFISKEFKITERTARRWLNELIETGYAEEVTEEREGKQIKFIKLVK